MMTETWRRGDDHMRRRMLAILSVLGLSLTVSGCGAGPPIIGGAGAVVPAATDPAPSNARAQAVLSAWTRAVAAASDHPAVIPVGELTGQLGDWEVAVGENNKIALMAGAVVSDKDLSSLDPGTGTVTWQD